MIKCELSHLEKAFNSIQEEFQDSSEIWKLIQKHFDEFRKDCNLDMLNYCIGRYIEAELDYVTPGERGLGRISTTPPRFAAYFRKQMARLSSEKKDELYEFIQDLILRSYLFRTLVYTGKSRRYNKNIKKLFESWISKIYISGDLLNQLSENIRDMFIIITKSAFKNLHTFFEINNFKGGGLFSRDKTHDILMFYVIAGSGLSVEKEKRS